MIEEVPVDDVPHGAAFQFELVARERSRFVRKDESHRSEVLVERGGSALGPEADLLPSIVRVPPDHAPVVLYYECLQDFDELQADRQRNRDEGIQKQHVAKATDDSRKKLGVISDDVKVPVPRVIHFALDIILGHGNVKVGGNVPRCNTD